jgi:hypothetical protein
MRCCPSLCCYSPDVSASITRAEYTSAAPTFTAIVDTQRLGDLLFGGTLCLGSVNMRDDTAVTLARDAHSDRDEFTGLTVEVCGLVAGGQHPFPSHRPARVRPTGPGR